MSIQRSSSQLWSGQATSGQTQRAYSRQEWLGGYSEYPMVQRSYSQTQLSQQQRPQQQLTYGLQRTSSQTQRPQQQQQQQITYGLQRTSSQTQRPQQQQQQQQQITYGLQRTSSQTQRPQQQQQQQTNGLQRSSSQSSQAPATDRRPMPQELASQRPPSQETSNYWVSARSETIETRWPNQDGKWMMFFPMSQMDAKWKQATDLYYAGKLTGINTMKGSTIRQNPMPDRLHGPNEGIIIFYCGPNEAEQDVKAWGRNILRHMYYPAEKFFYKSDIAEKIDRSKEKRHMYVINAKEFYAANGAPASSSSNSLSSDLPQLEAYPSTNLSATAITSSRSISSSSSSRILSDVGICNWSANTLLCDSAFILNSEILSGSSLILNSDVYAPLSQDLYLNNSLSYSSAPLAQTNVSLSASWVL